MPLPDRGRLAAASVASHDGIVAFEAGDLLQRCLFVPADGLGGSVGPVGAQPRQRQGVDTHLEGGAEGSRRITATPWQIRP